MEEKREHLDARRDAAELLAHGAWMRRLAAALAGAEGEDLVQETWLRVLTRPARSVERPRAWLAATLRNAARMHARGNERRQRREERAARDEAEPSTAELAARAELEQLAVRAVLDLDEPYREALLLRFVRELEPSEIARRLGVPASTVRNRLARGLELVRLRLDAKHGGERRAWAVLLVPFGREAVPASLGAGTVITGGLLLSAKWIVGGTVIALATAALWLMRAEHEPSLASSAGVPRKSEVALAADASHTAAAELAARDAHEVQGARIAVTAESTAATADGSATLILHVTWGRDGSPAVGIPVSVECMEAGPVPLLHEGTTDAQGCARFEGLLPGEQNALERTSGEYVEVQAGETRTVELVISPGVDVDCLVVDGDGAPVPGADVWLSYYGSSDGRVVGATDSSGRLLLRDVPGDTYNRRSIAARAAGRLASDQRTVTGNPGERLAVTLVLRGPGGSLQGIVRDASGAPIADAEVRAGAFSRSVSSQDGDSVETAPIVELRTDALGSFSCSGFATGTIPVAFRARGFAPCQVQVSITAGETTRKDFVLGPEALVVGVVRDGSGRALAGIAIGAEGARTSSSADGSFRLGSLAPGPCELYAHGNAQGNCSTRLQLKAGSEARWDPVLRAGGNLAGVVLDERDQPLEGWHVAALDGADVMHWMREIYTDAAGHFELVDCPPKPFSLAVRPGDGIFADPAELVDDFELGQADLVIHVHDDAIPASFVEGRVVSADGRELVQARVTYDSVLSRFGLQVFPDRNGSFRIGPLRAGRYTLTVEAEGTGQLRVDPFALEPRATKDVGTLVLERGGRIHAEIRPPDGVPLARYVQSQILAHGQYVASLDYEGTSGRSRLVSPGSYVLRTRSNEWYAPDRAVEVRAGETVDVELQLQQATNRRLTFVASDSEAPSRVHAIVRDEAGVVVCESNESNSEASRGDPSHIDVWVGGLLPGNYSVEAHSDTGRIAAGSFAVLDLTPVRDPIVLTLR